MPHDLSKFKDIAIDYGDNSLEEKHYPSITLDIKKFTEFQDARIGQKVEVMFRSNVRSIRLSEEMSTIELELEEASIYSIKNEKEENDSQVKENEEPITDADRALTQLMR